MAATDTLISNIFKWTSIESVSTSFLQSHHFPSRGRVFVQRSHWHVQSVRLGASTMLWLFSHPLGQSGWDSHGAEPTGKTALSLRYQIHYSHLFFQIGAAFSDTNISTFVIDAQVSFFIIAYTVCFKMMLPLLIGNATGALGPNFLRWDISQCTHHVSYTSE